MKFYFLIFSLFLIPYSMKGQFTDSLLVYIPINEKFDSLLFTFIEHEKQYDYFDSTCIFRIIFIDNSDSSTAIHMISGCEKNDFLNNSYMYKDQKGIFLLSSNNYYWHSILRGQQIDSTLISNTNEYFYFYSLKKKEISNNKFIFIDDDTHMETYWTYVYKDGNFYEISRFARNYGRIK